MGSFYVNACARDVTAEQLLTLLRRSGQTGFVGPTVGDWTSFVTEALESQDPQAIEAWGREVTRGSDAVALIFVCHDEDVLWVGLYQGGQEIGEFNSAPGYFLDDPSEQDFKPVLRTPSAFARTLGLDDATAMELLPADDGSEGPLELHERWAEMLGLPDYSVAMGFRYVKRGESPTEWTKV